MQRQYICIDFKSFFASVECVERGLDPMTARLVVADPERCETTICLAVSPALKKMGVKNRCRVYEIPDNIEYIKAPPQMKKYIEYSADIYAIYLKYVSKDDIYIYSIDEAFIDLTDYLSMYKMSARELGEKIRQDVLKTSGIPAAFGIGTNLYLAKIALDIEAKKSSEFIGELDEAKYITELWDHTPITDFWRIGAGTAARLEKLGITTMREIANAPDETLKSVCGIDFDILKDHAWGIEPTTIAEIKAYKTQSHSLSSGQVLSRDYKFSEGLTIAKEMTDSLALELFDNGLVSRSLTLQVTYSGFEREYARATQKLEGHTNSQQKFLEAAELAYRKCVDPKLTMRKISITINDVVEEGFEQQSIFDSAEAYCMDESENELIDLVRQAYAARNKIGCTGCAYCMPCPGGVEIPGTFRIWNDLFRYDKTLAGNGRYAGYIRDGKDASKCLDCGACEEACPQHLPIREKLKQADLEMR